MSEPLCRAVPYGTRRTSFGRYAQLESLRHQLGVERGKVDDARRGVEEEMEEAAAQVEKERDRRVEQVETIFESPAKTAPRAQRRSAAPWARVSVTGGEDRGAAHRPDPAGARLERVARAVG